MYCLRKHHAFYVVREYMWGCAGAVGCEWKSEDNLKNQCAPSAMWVLEDQTEVTGF